MSTYRQAPSIRDPEEADLYRRSSDPEPAGDIVEGDVGFLTYLGTALFVLALVVMVAWR